LTHAGAVSQNSKNHNKRKTDQSRFDKWRSKGLEQNAKRYYSISFGAQGETLVTLNYTCLT